MSTLTPVYSITLDYLSDGNSTEYIYTIYLHNTLTLPVLVAALSGNDIVALDIRLFSLSLDLHISLS